MLPFDEVPVLCLVFNRPQVTKKLVEILSKIKPKKIYIAADGPRSNKLGESERCDEVRHFFEDLSWKPKIKKLYRSENLGCGRAVSEGITWFFEHEEAGIILEDDCHPSESFFKFCSELLFRYQSDTRITQIAGSNFANDLSENGEDYYFSHHNHIWGWATWRRAWKLYDFSMIGLEDFIRRGNFDHIVNDHRFSEYLKKIMYSVKIGNINTWDYQWTFSQWKQNGLCIIPQKNLIKNIGFDQDATHTFDSSDQKAFREAEEIAVPLRHPQFVYRNIGADSITLSHKFNALPLHKRILKKFGFMR